MNTFQNLISYCETPGNSLIFDIFLFFETACTIRSLRCKSFFERFLLMIIAIHANPVIFALLLNTRPGWFSNNIRIPIAVLNWSLSHTKAFDVYNNVFFVRLLVVFFASISWGMAISFGIQYIITFPEISFSSILILGTLSGCGGGFTLAIFAQILHTPTKREIQTKSMILSFLLTLLFLLFIDYKNALPPQFKVLALGPSSGTLILSSIIFLYRLFIEIKAWRGKHQDAVGKKLKTQ